MKLPRLPRLELFYVGALVLISATLTWQSLTRERIPPTVVNASRSVPFTPLSAKMQRLAQLYNDYHASGRHNMPPQTEYLRYAGAIAMGGRVEAEGPFLLRVFDSPVFHPPIALCPPPMP